MFVGFQFFLQSQGWEGEEKLNQKRDSLLDSLARGTLELASNLWHFLEIWIKVNHKQVWEELTGKKGYLNAPFKFFFNNLYHFAFPDLTQHLRNLTQEPLNQSTETSIET
jgi:hypothetical protein